LEEGLIDRMVTISAENSYAGEDPRAAPTLAAPCVKHRPGVKHKPSVKHRAMDLRPMDKRIAVCMAWKGGADRTWGSNRHRFRPL